MLQNVSKWIGLAGVAEEESSLAQLWGKYFGFLLIAAVIWLAFQWHLELKGELSPEEAWTADLIVWMLFLTEVMVLTLLVHDRKRYLKTNWMSLFIIAAGLPLLFWEYSAAVVILRALRALLIIALVVPWIAVFFRFLSDNRLDTTIFAAGIILVFAGMLMASIDPSITTVEDGIWWAWVTISTVGYGDIVPSTTTGKIFAGALILVGMGLFSVITANFAAIFIKRSAKQNHPFQRFWEENFEKLDEIQANQRKLDQRLESLEQTLKSQSQSQSNDKS